MKSLLTARRALLTLACLALTPALAFAAGATVQQPGVIQAPASAPQWTFRIDVAVDHIPSKFVAVGAQCQVYGSSNYPIGQGGADQPLSGGAFSGTLSVPAPLAYGQFASQAKLWECDLYLKDTLGKIQDLRFNPDQATWPRPNTPRNLTLSGTF
jgi:hypothetical protein